MFYTITNKQSDVTEMQPTECNKKARIRWQDSAPSSLGYWPTSEPNAGDHDFPLTGSDFGNLTAFRAIFSHIFTAHAQERPLMNYFGDTRTFSDDFCIGYAECPPYLYFRSSWPTDLQSVSRAHASRWQFPPSLKLIRPSDASL